MDKRYGAVQEWVHYIRYGSNWFIPNADCALAWLRASGFQPGIHAEASSVLDRDWNNPKRGKFQVRRPWRSRARRIERSTVVFAATKTAEPHHELSHAYLGNFGLPTAGAVERAALRQSVGVKP